MLTQPSLQLFHDDTNQPLLLAGRHLPQQPAESTLYKTLVLAGVSSCHVVKQTVDVLNSQRTTVRTARLQDEKRNRSKVSSILTQSFNNETTTIMGYNTIIIR